MAYFLFTETDRSFHFVENPAVYVVLVLCYIVVDFRRYSNEIDVPNNESICVIEMRVFHNSGYSKTDSNYLSPTPSSFLFDDFSMGLMYLALTGFCPAFIFLFAEFAS